MCFKLCRALPRAISVFHHGRPLSMSPKVKRHVPTCLERSPTRQRCGLKQQRIEVGVCATSLLIGCSCLLVCVHRGNDTFWNELPFVVEGGKPSPAFKARLQRVVHVGRERIAQ